MKQLTRNRLTRLVIFAALVMLSIWVFNTYLRHTVPDDVVAITSSAKEPLVKEADLLVWARDAAIAAYTMQPDNIKTNLNTTSNYFTHNGWLGFYDALRASYRTVVLHSLMLALSAVGANNNLSLIHLLE